MKKNIFKTYIGEKELDEALQSGLLKASLRLNPRNYKEAYVSHPKSDCDILIYDKDINRALYDDIVAVQIHPKYEWKIQNTIYSGDSDMCNQMNRIMNNNVEENNNSSFITLRILLKKFPTILKEKFGCELSNDELNSSEDFPESCTNWWKYFQRTGYVAAIIHKMNSRFCVGSICLPENSKSLSYVRFIPTDIRYPRLIVSLTDCPTDFLLRPLDYKDVKFIARIGDWSEKDVNPKGHINQCLKNMTLIEQETMKILAECGFEDKEFNENILNSIPKETVTAEELKYRRDVRAECVFSIDPKTARDLDDALHIKELPMENGIKMWEVGVHIADVTYYVTPNSEIDQEASKRTTTVYMVHKAVPMLPRELCENLCSLHPGSDKLAYSVIYKMTDDCRIVDTWIGRTIINSACKLSYQDAQTVLDNPNKTDWDQSNFGQIFGSFNALDIACSILRLNHLAVQMRKRRFDSGSLWINQPKIGFVLNEERNIPLGYTTYKLAASNHLIEEWMLQANITIAQFIHTNLTKTAFLRCHPAPTAKAIDNINKQFKLMGWDNLLMKTGSTKEFQDLMKTFDKDAKSFMIMMNICNKSMQLALYFCNNCEDKDSLDVCHHFALNVPLYTHFTSPIRRYPDVIVHRQITQILMMQQSAIGAQGDDSADKLKWMERTATGEDCTTTKLSYMGDYCNKKKKDAKTADESSIILFYSLFVEKSGPFSENGIVMGVLDKAFDVYLCHCGFTKRVYLDQLDAKKASFNKTLSILTIFWNSSPACVKQKHAVRTSTISIMMEVNIAVSAINQGDSCAPKLKLILINPGCELCQSNSVEVLREITSMQCQLSIVDEDRLYNILDDI